MAEAGADVVGVDWRIPLDEAGEPRRARTHAVQGNLDPALCLAPVAGGRAAGAPGAGRGRRHPAGHIFNLGHGVLPETDPAVLGRIVELVHAWPGPATGRDRAASRSR